MPEFLAPGVYIEEIQRGPRPIDGVSTSTAGFVGETERGSTKPTLVTSWSDFVRTFGGYVDQPPFTTANIYLPYAVRGFFDNGGQRLYVARVVGAGAQTAAGALPGANGDTTIQASGPGLWGNNLRIAVTPASAAASGRQGATGPAANWFRIRIVYYRDGVSKPLIDPGDPAELGNPLRREPDAYEDFDDLSADSTEPNFAGTVINGASKLIRILACPSRPNDVTLDGGALTKPRERPRKRSEISSSAITPIANCVPGSRGC